jgi:hypothetical protein
LLGYTIERELGKLPCLKIREERKMKELDGDRKMGWNQGNCVRDKPDGINA